MDSQSRKILTAAIIEKRELVQMLYMQGYQSEGLAQYIELRRLGQSLKDELNGDTRTDNQGTGDDQSPE